MNDPSRRLSSAIALGALLAASVPASAAPPKAPAPTPPTTGPAGEVPPPVPELPETTQAVNPLLPAAPMVTLDASVRAALARNPTYVTAIEEVRRAHAAMRETRAQALPTLAAIGSYTRLDSDRISGGVIVTPRDSLNGNLTLTAPLVHPQKWAAWSHADDQIDVSAATRDDVRRLVAVETARAFLTIVAQKRQLEIAVRARDTAQAHADYTHARFTGGVGNRIDDVRALQEVSTDAAQIEADRSSIVRAREALAILTGDEQAADATTDDVLPAPPSFPDAMNGSLSRTDVVAAQRRVDAASHAKRDDWTDYSPYLLGAAEGFLQSPATATVPATGWQAELLLTIPLYDGGYRYGAAEDRDAVYDEARVAQENTLRQAKSDVRTAFYALERADDALRAARDAARLAREALDLANVAYRTGTLTNLEVIDAERAARDAESGVAIAEDTSRQARLDLLAASGRFP